MTLTFPKRALRALAFAGLIMSGAAYADDAVAPVEGAQVQTSQPQAVVREFYDRLTEVMRDGHQLGFEGRCKKLAPAIETAFNLPLMARIAVGFSWTDASSKQQEDLVAAFSDFSIATYANRFASYNGEQFSVLGEKPAGKDIVVETSLKPKDGEPVSLNYLMRADEQGNYRIVDVFLNGTISELATRRSEFSSIARRDGISALVNSLGQKSRQMGAS